MTSQSYKPSIVKPTNRHLEIPFDSALTHTSRAAVQICLHLKNKTNALTQFMHLFSHGWTTSSPSFGAYMKSHSALKLAQKVPYWLHGPGFSPLASCAFATDFKNLLITIKAHLRPQAMQQNSWPNLN